jgi:glycosyltransferase involved in cell wall biosynthesis
VVTTLHNPDYGFEDPGTLLFRAKKEVDRITGNSRNAAFVAVSEAVRADYSRQLGFSPIHVLHNFVILQELDDALGRVDRPAARRELGVGEEELLILHVGRHHRQKGLDLLFEALARLRAAGVPAVFRQAGQGGLTEALEDQARSLGLGTTARLLGLRADVASLYRAADIFAFPSRFEAFGISLLEAMAARLPCVASATGGIEEVVGGSGAILVTPGDVSALTSALLQLCLDRNLRSRLGDAARARAEVFDVHAQLPRLEALYATL